MLAPPCRAWLTIMRVASIIMDRDSEHNECGGRVWRSFLSISNGSCCGMEAVDDGNAAPTDSLDYTAAHGIISYVAWRTQDKTVQAQKDG